MDNVPHILVPKLLQINIMPHILLVLKNALQVRNYLICTHLLLWHPFFLLSHVILPSSSALPPGYQGCFKNFKGSISQVTFEDPLSKDPFMSFDGCLELCRAKEGFQWFAWEKWDRRCVCVKSTINTKDQLDDFRGLNELKRCKANHKFQVVNLFCIYLHDPA